MTTLLIARHGNTFDPGDTLVRVGLKTDLPLSLSGRIQAQKLGKYFLDNNTQLAAVYTSTLKRTIETATVALDNAKINCNIFQDHIFDEIDYGPDEAKTEEEVIARIGSEALQSWDTDAIVPRGWLIDPKLVISNWINFAKTIHQQFPEQTVLVITSNGIARFAPYLTGNFAQFANEHNIKLSTGALCSLTNNTNNDNWHVDFWNIKIT